jgi:hypothetical protein
MTGQLLGQPKSRRGLKQPMFHYPPPETSVDPDGVLVHHFVAEPVTMPAGYGTRLCATAADYHEKPSNPTKRSRNGAGLFTF